MMLSSLLSASCLKVGKSSTAAADVSTTSTTRQCLAGACAFGSVMTRYSVHVATPLQWFYISCTYGRETPQR